MTPLTKVSSFLLGLLNVVLTIFFLLGIFFSMITIFPYIMDMYTRAKCIIRNAIDKVKGKINKLKDSRKKPFKILSYDIRDEKIKPIIADLIEEGVIKHKASLVFKCNKVEILPDARIRAILDLLYITLSQRFKEITDVTIYSDAIEGEPTLFTRCGPDICTRRKLNKKLKADFSLVLNNYDVVTDIKKIIEGEEDKELEERTQSIKEEFQKIEDEARKQIKEEGEELIRKLQEGKEKEEAGEVIEADAVSFNDVQQEIVYAEDKALADKEKEMLEISVDIKCNVSNIDDIASFEERKTSENILFRFKRSDNLIPSEENFRNMSEKLQQVFADYIEVCHHGQNIYIHDVLSKKVYVRLGNYFTGPLDEKRLPDPRFTPTYDIYANKHWGMFSMIDGFNAIEDSPVRLKEEGEELEPAPTGVLAQKRLANKINKLCRDPLYTSLAKRVDGCIDDGIKHRTIIIAINDLNTLPLDKQSDIIDVLTYRVFNNIYLCDSQFPNRLFYKKRNFSRVIRVLNVDNVPEMLYEVHIESDTMVLNVRAYGCSIKDFIKTNEEDTQPDKTEEITNIVEVPQEDPVAHEETKQITPQEEVLPSPQEKPEEDLKEEVVHTPQEQTQEAPEALTPEVVAEEKKDHKTTLTPPKNSGYPAKATKPRASRAKKKPAKK